LESFEFILFIDIVIILQKNYKPNGRSYIAVLNIDWFKKYFHWHSNKFAIKRSHAPYLTRFTNLPCEITVTVRQFFEY